MVNKASLGYVVISVVASAAMIGKHAQAILMRVVQLESTAGAPPTVVTSAEHVPSIVMSTM